MLSSGKALGRGLASLIPVQASQVVQGEKESGAAYFLCPIEKIVANRDQPRRIFSKGALEELAASIRENGVIQPLIVRELGGERYELIAGERRLRAAGLAGLKEVPVVVLENAAERSLELALIENIQRQDLNPIEEGLAYKQLMDRYQYTQEQCAGRVGKDRSTVANSIRLLYLPEEIRGYLVDGRLSMGHARALLGIGQESELLELARKAVGQGLSVRQVEELARSSKGSHLSSKKVVSPKKNAQLSYLESEMTRVLEAKVRIQSKGKGGCVMIHYASSEELDRIVNVINS